MTPDLFDWALARRSDPDTAHDAARSLDGAPVTSLEEICLAAIIAADKHGLTSHELAAATRLELVTVSPRLRPLANKGLIADSGRRRPGDSGRLSIVWVAR